LLGRRIHCSFNDEERLARGHGTGRGKALEIFLLATITGKRGPKRTHRPSPQRVFFLV